MNKKKVTEGFYKLSIAGWFGVKEGEINLEQ